MILLLLQATCFMKIFMVQHVVGNMMQPVASNNVASCMIALTIMIILISVGSTGGVGGMGR